MGRPNQYRKNPNNQTGQIMRSFTRPKPSKKPIQCSKDRSLLMELYETVKETAERSGGFQPSPGSLMYRVRQHLYGEADAKAAVKLEVVGKKDSK